ncbi:paraneoplastic antigen Ma2-like [Misgurnus anguillicaudatus]|uniref:paraneoplastic antigen Ma2-like n=1 Tax=Misgurnus anguillicaudatus TaxID=75329 RepID=UPI003CCF9AE8
MAQLKNWCIGEGMDPVKALLVKDVPPETEVGFIEDTLQTIKALGRVKVRGRMYDSQSQSLTVLCECREKVNADAIPLDVVPEGFTTTWRIFGPSKQDEEPQAPPTCDGQNVPLPDSSVFSPLQGSTPEAIIRAVVDVLQMTSKPTQGNNLYRRLRTFSGVMPTPQGEEQLENWVEQARLMNEECDRPEPEKKMRIMESVKGPALEILQAVRFNNPSATSMDYIDILETTFGNPESGEELYFAFRMLCQHHNEKLSEFLRRLERVLNKVVQKGGLQSSAADKARLDQLIKGATKSDIMILNLGLRYRRDSPPTFLELMNEIRLEEEHEAARRRLHPPKAVYAKSATVTSDTELNDLKAEIRQLRAQSSQSVVLLLSPAYKRPSQDPGRKDL